MRTGATVGNLRSPPVLAHRTRCCFSRFRARVEPDRGSDRPAHYRLYERVDMYRNTFKGVIHEGSATGS